MKRLWIRAAIVGIVAAPFVLACHHQPDRRYCFWLAITLGVIWSIWDEFHQ